MGSSQDEAEGKAAGVAPHDSRAGGRLRGAVMLLPAILIAFAYMLGLALICLIAPGWVRKRSVSIIRIWGHLILKMLGIRVEVHGREHLAQSGPRIVLFNHVNVFDLVVLATIWDEGFSVIYKKEFHKIPIMGRLMRFFGMIPIDRSNRERAVKSMQQVAELIREQDKRVLVAPEGTRSHDGRLAAFKRGPFHLALDTRAPMMPLIMRGIEDLVQGLKKPPRTGVVRVDLLAPIPTNDWTVGTLEERVDEVRALYLQYLPDATRSA